MATRIFVVSTAHDTRAHIRKQHLTSLGLAPQEVWLADVYTIDRALTPKELREAAMVLTNPVTQESFLKSYIPAKSFDWVIETGFLPGVTDNVAATAKEMISDHLGMQFGAGEGLYTSQATFIAGYIPKKSIESLAAGLINPLIGRVAIKDGKQYRRDRGMDVVVPTVRLQQRLQVGSVDLHLSDDELAVLGKQGIANADGSRRGPLALDLPSLQAIAAYFAKEKRKPTDVELESIAQTWSEHCKHTIFSRPLDQIHDGLYKHYIKRATEIIRKQLGQKDFCSSVFADNSGAIVFDKNYLVTHKVETHNSPSALDPFGGAITGIVGVNRDAIGFGLGAKPIANTYGFCFADPSDTTVLYRDSKQTQPLLSPRRIMDGVIAGVNSGGNCSGIPTPQGFLAFDPRFAGKPLVFVGTVGLIPKKHQGKRLDRKAARPGDYVVMVGGRVGLDGIHGATFSSEALTSGSPATAVQIGDPIAQKKLSDALVKEARDLGLFSSITDNGAGGLSCSVAEMAKECGGCQVDLEKVPLKYPGLAPWQIWISESQERMSLAVPKGKWKRLKSLLDRRGVEATVIGQFTKSGRCIVRYNKKIIMDLEMEFLHNGLPKLAQHSEFTVVAHPEPTIPRLTNWTNVLLELIASPNLCSFSWISAQFDHEVGGASVTKPLQGRGRVNADVTVLRPIQSSPRGIVLTQALYPRYSDIDTYAMAAAAIDTAVRRSVTAGAGPGRIALLDNFCWCSARDPQRLGQLARAAAACFDYAVAYKTPFISGKDSMFNDFSGYDANGKPIKISIPPTLLISAIGLMDDVTGAVTLDAKFSGDLVYILGETREELGASEYYAYLSNKTGQQAIGSGVPRVDAQKNLLTYRALAQAIEHNLVASAQSVDSGGLAVALVKSALGGRLGLDLSLQQLPGAVRRDDQALFSESAGRVVVTIDSKNKSRFEKLLRGIAYRQLGTVTDKPIVKIRGLAGRLIVDTALETLHRAYTERFAKF